MQSRTLQAVVSCGVFLGVAVAYKIISGAAIDELRVLLWSIAGVASYIALCGVFGFDPHRTRVAQYAPPLLHYVDRWELRLGQATLAMLGCLVVAARFIDATNFVTAVVSGTLCAWTYFVLRWYAGGYKSPA
jgi:hypothetical protein